MAVPTPVFEASGLTKQFGEVTALNLVVTHVPDMVGSGAAQCALLGLLVILSQVLHWRGLQRFLTTHDLVGDTV